jgi:hypothetical protein
MQAVPHPELSPLLTPEPPSLPDPSTEASPEVDPLAPHPAVNPTTAAARPASTASDVNGFPTSPAHRQGPRMSSGGGVVAEMAARAADGDPRGRACDGQGRDRRRVRRPKCWIG